MAEANGADKLVISDAQLSDVVGDRLLGHAATFD
jgi:hypothetical protein